MDPSIIDASRYKLTNLSLDSRFADTFFHSTGDYLIKLPSVTKNIARIALVSIEIPNVEWLFSEHHGNINISWRPANTHSWTDVSIPQGNYASDELATAVGDALGSPFTVSLDPHSGQVTISSTSDFVMRFAAYDERIASRRSYWGLGYYLGFRHREVASVGKSITGSSLVLVQSSPYYLIQLKIPDPVESLQHRLWDNGWVSAFAKVILRDGTYTIEFDDGGNNLRKEHNFLTPVNVASMRVRVVDPFGDTVNLHDMDWSMTIELYEIVNSRVHAALGQTYGRD